MRKNSQSGFTLAELMVATMILVFAFLAVMIGYIRCMDLNDLSRNSSYAIKAVKSRMETIKNTPFVNLSALYNNVTFTSPNLPGGIGVSYVDTTTADLYKVTVVFCWKQKNGRVVGEDKNLNGVLNVGEDLDGNGLIGSIVEVVNYVYNET